MTKQIKENKMPKESRLKEIQDFAEHLNKIHEIRPFERRKQEARSEMLIKGTEKLKQKINKNKKLNLTNIAMIFDTKNGKKD